MSRHRTDEGPVSRREFLRFGLLVGAALGSGSLIAKDDLMHRRRIPGTREEIPVIGLGSWQTFDVGGQESERAPLREVMGAFAGLGGRVVDSSPMYGESETVLGDVATEADVRARLFLATKVWTYGRESGVRQMTESFRRLRTERMDLMQIHNLQDWRTHVKTLREWKERGRIRYIGITHYTEHAYDEIERVIDAEPIDFLQINYSIAERAADARLLNRAQEKGIGVLVNRPFAKGGLFARVRNRPLPPWAADIDCATWAQFFLKFVVSHPAVTCAIPATGKVKHLIDNMGGGVGRLPDRIQREKMAGFVENQI